MTLYVKNLTSGEVAITHNEKTVAVIPPGVTRWDLGGHLKGVNPRLTNLNTLVSRGFLRQVQ